MKKQRTLIDVFEMFFTYMADLYFPGWEDSLTKEQIDWHWEEFRATVSVKR